jgi:hypothetical protein
MNTTPKESISVKCFSYKEYNDIKGDLKEGEIENFVITTTNVLSEVKTIRDSQINLYDELLINQDKSVAPHREEIGGYINNINTNTERLNTEYTNTKYTNTDNDNIFSFNMKFFSGYNRDSLKTKILRQKNTLNEFLKKLKAFLSLTNSYKENIFTIQEQNAYTRKPVVIPDVHPFKGGAYNKTNKKSILGKERCIYKKSGDRKEYIKYKGNLIAVREYKKLMKILKKK